jgi:hypothetical protein
MKTTLKTYLFILAIISSFISCSKDGNDGTEGPQGVPGKTGNANVVVYNFPGFNFNGVLQLTIPNVTQGFVDSSMISVYFSPQPEAPTTWYQAPGLGSSGAYELRYYLSKGIGTNYVLTLRTEKPDGSGPFTTPITFNKLRVFFTQATTVVPMSTSSGANPKLDYADYFAVCRYYNIPEY